VLHIYDISRLRVKANSRLHKQQYLSYIILIQLNSVQNLNSLTSILILSTTHRPHQAGWLVTGLSQRRPGFELRPVRVGFVVGKVRLGQVFSGTLGFPVSVIRPVIHNQFASPRRYISLAIDTVLKQHAYKFYPPIYCLRKPRALLPADCKTRTYQPPVSPCRLYTTHHTPPPPLNLLD